MATPKCPEKSYMINLLTPMMERKDAIQTKLWILHRHKVRLFCCLLVMKDYFQKLSRGDIVQVIVIIEFLWCIAKIREVNL